MKGIRPIHFLLATLLLVCVSLSVPIAYGAEDAVAFELPRFDANAGDDESSLDGAPADDGNEGDPDDMGDGFGRHSATLDGGCGGFDGMTIEEYLLHLLSQIQLLLL
jgi:hypothetical protein